MNNFFQLSEAEVVTAMKIHGKGSNKALAVLGLIGFFWLLVGLFTPYKGTSFGIIIGGVIAYFVIYLFYIPFNAKRQYKQLRALREEMSVTLSDNGVNIKGANGEGNLEWRDIHKWKYAKDIYLLYITSRMFHMIPARALANKAELRELLVKHVGANEI